MDWKLLLLIFFILVLLDKGLTAANILLVNKNYPLATKSDYYLVEKNPIAKWCFSKFNLAGGTLTYGIISILTLFIAFYILSFIFSERIALYVIFILYGLVIANNVYFLLKYARIIS